jgi:hypothetical protein
MIVSKGGHMKRTIFFVVVASLIILASCAPYIYVTRDYDRRADFGTYKTYNWMPRPDKMPRSARAALERNPLLDKHIRDITEQILATKGMTLSTTNPDILINYYVGYNDRIDINNWGYFYGPFWGYYWPGLGPYDVYSYKEGTLVMDFVDAKKNEMVWRGVAEEDIFTYDYAPMITESQVARILTKMLALYPPLRGAGYPR